MFAAIEMELDLNANGTKCSVFVNTGGTVTTSGTCTNLTTSLSGGDHGQLTVGTKTGKTFGGIVFTDTAQGHGFVAPPQLQDVNQTQATSSSATGTFTTLFTDTDVVPATPQFAITTTFNAISKAGTADFFAYNSKDKPGDIDILPAAHLIGKTMGEAGPVTSNSNIYLDPDPGAPYSLTTQLVIHFVKRSQVVTASQQIAAFGVPEPGSIVLMGTMLLLSGAGLRRKLKR